MAERCVGEGRFSDSELLGDEGGDSEGGGENSGEEGGFTALRAGHEMISKQSTTRAKETYPTFSIFPCMSELQDLVHYTTLQ